MAELVLTAMRDAFLNVSVFVAVVVLLFSALQYATAGRLVDWIQSSRRVQPLVGALLGLTPGCGGAIIVMPMYARGCVSYGTVLATLIATLGDSAFVLLGAVLRDRDFLVPVVLVHAISFSVAVVWGYAADAARVTPSQPIGRWTRARGLARALALQPHTDEAPTTGLADSPSVIESLPRERPGGLAHAALHGGYIVWWIVALAGFAMGVCILAWSAQDPDFETSLEWDLRTREGWMTWVGVVGTMLSLLLYVSSKRLIRADTEATVGDKLNSLRETLIHAAGETAFVTTWIVAVFVAFELATEGLGLSLDGLARSAGGWSGVLVAAAVGLLPGCGPQVLTVTAYTKGALSFPALVANAIAQDGDALLPLLVRHRGAAGWATLHTLVPALLVGGGLVALGVQLP